MGGIRRWDCTSIFRKVIDEGIVQFPRFFAVTAYECEVSLSLLELPASQPCAARRSPGERRSEEGTVRELIRDTEQSNADLQVANSPQAITLQGRPARKLDWFGKSAVRESGQQLTERVRMIALQQKTGLILYLVFVAPEPDFYGWLPVFDRMLNSLRIR